MLLTLLFVPWKLLKGHAYPGNTAYWLVGVFTKKAVKPSFTWIFFEVNQL